MIFNSLSFFLFSFSSYLLTINGIRLAGECYDICNSFKREVLTLEMCREAKKLLPRPKIGDFCTRAMEDGFKDACFALCQDQKPVPRIAQACRAAAMELPRPTVRKWCEHGYRQGFKATIDSLSTYFGGDFAPAELEQTIVPKNEEIQTDEPEPPVQGPSVIMEPEPVTVPKATPEPTLPAPVPKEPIVTAKPTVIDLPIVKSIPITLDEVVYDLNIYEGQGPEDSVASFCAKYMSEEIAECIRQLLPVVFDQM